MEYLFEILEFLYYGIIIFIIIIFFSMLIDISISKLFPSGEHNFILVELFITWVLIVLLCFYCKKIISYIPCPFGKAKVLNDNTNIIILYSLIPILISISLINMKNKSTNLYNNINKLFFNF